MQVDEDGEVVTQVRPAYHFVCLYSQVSAALFRQEVLSLSTQAKLHSSTRSCSPLTSAADHLCLNSAIDHHRTDPLFATASNTVQLWDETK